MPSVWNRPLVAVLFVVLGLLVATIVLTAATIFYSESPSDAVERVPAMDQSRMHTETE